MQFGGSHLKKKAPLFPARERWEGGRTSERDGMQASGPHDGGAALAVLSLGTSGVAGRGQACAWWP